MNKRILAGKTFATLATLILAAGFLLNQVKLAHAGPQPAFDYAKMFGGTGPDFYYAETFTLASDNAGNVYSAGYFQGVIDFDPGAGVFEMQASPASLYIMKLDSSGNFVWAKEFEGTGFNAIQSLSLDDDGNVLATGYFNGTTDFDPGAGVFNLTEFGGFRDTYVVKLDNDGDFVWAVQPAGTGGDEAKSVRADDIGNVYIAGHFRTTIDADPGVGVHNLVNNGSNDDGYVIKLDSDGIFVWAHHFASATNVNERARNLTTDSDGNLYIVGSFGGAVDFDSGIGVQELIGSSLDMYVLKLDSNGSFIWVKGMFSDSSFGAETVQLDSVGNVMVAGTFYGTGDFDPGVGTFNLVGNRTAYVQKLDPNGDFIWAKSYGMSGTHLFYSMGIDSDNNIYTYGTLGGTDDIDPGPGVVNLTGSSAGNIYVMQLDEDGDFQWVMQFPDGDGSWVADMIVDSNDAVYVGGAIEGSGDVDPSAGVFTLTSLGENGDGDPFIMKLSQPIPPTVTASAATDLTETSATLNGNITSTGGATVTDRGFEYGLDNTYGSSTTLESGSFGTGAFTSSLTGLTCNTTYHFQAIATNSQGTGDSSDQTFVTLPCSATPPTVTTDVASSITRTTVTLNGNITGIGTSAPTDRGFEYGTSLAYGTTTIESGSFGTGAFTGNIASLTCNTLYHYRAYATSTDGTGNGSDSTFTTAACATSGGGGSSGSSIIPPVTLPVAPPATPPVVTTPPVTPPVTPTTVVPIIPPTDITIVTDPNMDPPSEQPSIEVDQPDAPVSSSYDRPPPVNPVHSPNRVKSFNSSAQSLLLLTFINLATLMALVPLASHAINLSLLAAAIPLGLTGAKLIYIRYFQNLLSFLGLRRKRRIWGTVYDSQTKQPLDPVIVELIDANTGLVKETAITDLAGRFGFLAVNGKYLLKASKTHYAFPSVREVGQTDEIFENLYHGEPLEISETSSLVAPNIPMDPIGFDWNQEAKQELLPSRLRLEYFAQLAFNLLFIVGFIFSIYNIVMSPNWWNIIVFSLYILIFILRFIIGKKRLWGRLFKNGKALPKAILELSEPQMGVVMGRALTAEDGKFFLKAPAPGQYKLTIKPSSTAEPIFSTQVKVGKESVFNEVVELS